MEKRNLALIQMQIECMNCLDRNHILFAGFDPLESALIELHNLIAEIKLKQQWLDQDIKAYTIDKKNRLYTMADAVTAMRKKVQAVALSKNDIVSFDKINFSRTRIIQSAGLTSVSRAKNVYDMAFTLSPEDRNKFHINNENLQDLQSAIKKYEIACLNRSGTNILHKNARIDFAAKIKFTSNFIRTTINSLMGNYQFTTPSFYNEWLLSQRIINPSQHHAQITGTVTDQSSLQPLQMVKVKAISGNRIYEDMTDSEGKYKLPVNPEVWNVTFELPTYAKEDKTNIIVDSGEKEILNVSLVPVAS